MTLAASSLRNIFFLAIRAGRSVRQAFDCGIQVLRSSPNKQFLNDAAKFVLLPENAQHSEALAAHGPRCGSPEALHPTRRALPEERSWGALPARVEDFVGREVDMSLLLQSLKDNSHQRRCVEVFGSSGIGKAALMAEMGRFVKLRHNIFSEVFWIEKCQGNSAEVSIECEEGLKRLRARLMHIPRKRVLLLIGNPYLVLWSPVLRLLDMPNVHIVVKTTSDVQWVSEVHDSVTAAGAKPVRFDLGALEPLAQARLFLSRASRPLYNSEVLGQQYTSGTSHGAFWRPSKPVDYLVLASSSLLLQHAGNPRSISIAAQELKSDGLQAARKPRHELMCRKVRLVMPDGSERCEWLESRMLVRDVAQDLLPELQPDRISVFIEGCRAQPNMPLSCFKEDASLGFLVVELRIL